MNIRKVLDLMGGIKKIIGPNDVVVIKPNFQWWNQGAPNLEALHTFVDLIMERPGGFYGEVIIAENCHRGPSPWNSSNSGWAHQFDWNSDNSKINNANELVALLKKRYEDKFSCCYWIDVQSGSKRVYGPANGDGYVYCDGTNGVPLIDYNNEAEGTDNRTTIMTYPIFSSDRGTIIDFKNGVWEKGSYTDQPLRFINFAALNYHSVYCGMTSALKNYLGVTDLSGGPDPLNNGHLTEKYYNFHSFPFNEWDHGPIPGMIGAEVGVFMNTIRKADLNITTAEWIGLSSRTDLPVAHTRAVLASTDPVALDYHAAKYILYPNSKIVIHNPDNRKSPLYHYLKECANKDGGSIDEHKVAVTSYDHLSKKMQKNTELVVKSDRIFGTNVKQIMKYIVLRSKLML